jgi:hypothetical protein
MNVPLGRLALSTLFLLLCAVALAAQDLDDVTIRGQVMDSNSLAVAGAAISAIQVETGLDRTVTTDDSGRFQIVKLKPGTYKVKVSSTGFGAQERTDLRTVSGQVVQLEFKLSPGLVTAEQTVSVTDEDAPAVDATRTVVGDTLTQREIEEIPNNTRNPLDLVLTLGGTSEEQLSTSGLADDRNQNPKGTPLEQGNFSLSGGTAYSNNITIDGLDNNDDRSSRDRFQPSLEAIAEVQVIKNQFSAEYGRASGGRVNIRTRSGGNRLRGRAFMFFRDGNLNANTWYNNSRAVPRPPLTEYDPGFFISGPISLPHIYDGHNRTFFAVGYEYLNLRDTTLIDTYVPVVPNPHYTLPVSNGNGQFCDNATPSNCPATAGFISPYTDLYNTPNVSNVLTARVDHRLFKGNDLTVGFQFARKHNRRTNGTATTRIENAFQEKNNNTQAYNITDNQVIGANIVNQFRAQWSEYKPSYQTLDPLVPVVLVGFRNPITNTVQTLIAGNSTTNTSLNFADSRDETRWQFQDSLTYIMGRHTFKGGFDAQTVVSKTLGLGAATGTFNFGSVLQYSNNQVTRYRQNFGTSQDVHNTYYGLFFNDEWRARSDLTVSYGLRYERETAIGDDNNWGPRLGIAWRTSKNAKSVIRFGAGIFYNRVLLRTVGDSIQNTGGNLVSFDSNTIGTAATDPRRGPILTAISNRFPNSYASIDDLRALIVSTCATIVTTFPCNANTGFATNVSSAGNPLRSVDANLEIPESYQFNVGFEREVLKGWVFEANYTWNRTVRLWRDYNPNVPVLPAGFADWTAYLLNNTYDLTNQNGTIRTYQFVLGSTTDGSGVIGTTGSSGNVCSFTLTNTCTVNLNSINTATTFPAAAVNGSNNNATGTPLGIALAAIAKFRPDQTVEETSRIGARGRAFYQGLILELRSRYRKLGHGFRANFRLAYTLSSTKDDGVNNTANAEINGDFAREWARSLQDRRHRIALTGTLETPSWFGKLKFSPLLRYGSSAPFNLGAGGSDRNLDDLGTDRLNFNGNLKDIVWRGPGTPVPDTLIAQFSLPPIGAAGSNLPRNAGTGPSYYMFDLNVSRDWKLGENIRLRPVLEIDNIFNAAVFSYGAEFVDFQALRNDGIPATATQQLARDNFLVPTRTYRPREIRLGLRFDF